MTELSGSPESIRAAGTSWFGGNSPVHLEWTPLAHTLQSSWRMPWRRGPPASMCSVPTIYSFIASKGVVQLLA